MRVFITGATGFVGRYVMAEIHASGHDILASLRYGRHSHILAARGNPTGY